MIPQKAIDQAVGTHLADMAKYQNRLVNSLDSLNKALHESYDGADKALKDSLKTIGREEKDELDRAYRSYQAGLGTPEGGKFTTLEAERRGIEARFAKQRGNAWTHHTRSCGIAEDRFRIGFKNIMKSYSDDCDTAIAKLSAEHPGGGEGELVPVSAE